VGKDGFMQKNYELFKIENFLTSTTLLRAVPAFEKSNLKFSSFSYENGRCIEFCKGG